MPIADSMINLHLSNKFLGSPSILAVDWETLKLLSSALADVTQWIEYWPVNPSIAGSIPSQSKCLDCGPGPQ